MENKLTKRCCLGKFLGEDCDKTTCCRNIGRLDTSNFDEKIIDLMQKRSLHTFKTSDISAFIMRKFTRHAMKHCRYVLTHIKYIRKKLAKDFIFQNPPLQ